MDDGNPMKILSKVGMRSDEAFSESQEGNGNPSLKSLMKSKQAFEGPDGVVVEGKSIQKIPKHKGAASIKNLIRSAATRDKD